MKYLILGLALAYASAYALPTNDEYQDRKFSSEVTGSDVDNNEVRQLDAIGGGNLLRRQDHDAAGERLLRQVRRPGLDSLSGGGFGVSKRMDSLSGKYFGEQKRNFDEIDRSGFNSFAKKNFDEIDRSGFNGFVKKNFDEIDRSGFNGFVKKNFDEIDRSGFDSFVKRNFDEIDRVGFSNFLKRSIPELLARYHQSKGAN